MKTTNYRTTRGGLAFIVLAAMFFIGLPLNARAASPGSLDPTFGKGGKVTHDVQVSDVTKDVAVQPDGKIVVVGYTAAVDSDFCVVRYNTNGTLDTTFDGDGVVTTDFLNSANGANGVAIQPDGKIVVVGYTRGADTANNASTAAARYLPSGALDTTFDTDGKVVVDVLASASDSADSVAIQDDGKIVTVGYAGTDFSILRLNLNGSLNVAFDTDGIVLTDFNGSADEAHDVVIQPDGKIVAGGTADSDFGVARYNVNGSLDTTFSTNGKIRTDFNGDLDQLFGLAIQVDGKLVGAGGTITGGLNDFALVRYNTNGSLDTTFDTDGKVVTNIYPGAADFAQEIAIQSDGKIIAVGAASTNNANFLAARYNANGSLDAAFGTNGIIKTDFGVGIENAYGCALSGDKLVVAGNAINNNDFAVARYNLLASPTAVNDFDGDGFSDYAVFRPATSNWFILRSTDATTVITSFGSNGDVPLDGDFDGDGKSDLAIYRPSVGQWWFQRSSDNTVLAAQFGTGGDKPIPSDVDKDGKTDFVVWRASNGNWYILRSSDGFSSYFSFPFGANGDVPVGAAIFP
jgi:uncharacterized delta-60 repeat protein